MSEGRLLLIEDDARLGALVADYLQKAGFSVEVERDGRRGRQRVLEQPPDLLILDLLLPGEDGLSICRAVRPHFRGPILMLTAQ
ncbi:MAG TPA: response regulator, partial [Myxococcota bacterium]|nr:response regulator [Myxococcota bacterium]